MKQPRTHLRRQDAPKSQYDMTTRSQKIKQARCHLSEAMGAPTDQALLDLRMCLGEVLDILEEIDDKGDE